MNFSIYQYGMEYVTLFGIEHMGMRVRQVSYLPEEIQEKVRGTLVQTDDIKDLKIWLDERSMTQCMFTAYIGDDVYHVDTTSDNPVVKDGEEINDMEQEPDVQEEQAIVESAKEPEPVQEPEPINVQESSAQQDNINLNQVNASAGGSDKQTEMVESSQVLPNIEKPLEPVVHKPVTAKVQPTGFDMSFMAPPTIVGRRKSRARDVTPNKAQAEKKDESTEVKPEQNVIPVNSNVEVNENLSKDTSAEPVEIVQEIPKVVKPEEAVVPKKEELANVSREILEAPDEAFQNVMAGAYSTGRMPDVGVKKNTTENLHSTTPKEEEGCTTGETLEEETKQEEYLTQESNITEQRDLPVQETEESNSVEYEEKPLIPVTEDTTEDTVVYERIQYNPVLLQHIDNYSVKEIDMDAVAVGGDAYCKANNWYQCDNIFLMDDVSQSLRCVHSDSYPLHMTIPYSEVMKFGGH